MEITRIGSFVTGWGESLVWDERRARLWFVDCATQTLHWLDAGSETPAAFRCPTMPAGIVPTEDGLLAAMLDDGIHLVDPDAGTSTLVAPYPAEMGGRANDACADPAGAIITGKLNMEPAPGGAWRWSSADGWSLLDDDIANTNGPAVLGSVDDTTLIVGDTSAHYYAYPYDVATGTVGERRIFGEMTDAFGGGKPDGSTVDSDGGLWCALVGGGRLARFTDGRLDRVVAVPVAMPTDVAFGGPDLDRLYVVSIAGEGDLDGSLLAIDGLGVTGRPEPRCTVG